MNQIDSIQQYIESLKESAFVFKAEKKGCVFARIGNEGEKIVTYVSSGDIETINTIKKDIDGNLGIVAIRADQNGKKITDTKGHENVYIIERTVFNERYAEPEKLSCKESFFKPKGYIQSFIQINEDICFDASWGEKQYLHKGGFLNVTELNDIYGIEYKEFIESYSFIDMNDYNRIMNF